MVIVNSSDNDERVRTASIFKKPTYLAVVPVIFFMFLVVMGLAPLAEQILIDAVCVDLKSDDCGSTEVSANSADLTFAAAIALNAPAVLLSGFYGSVADKYGRKSVMIITLVGLLLDTCIQFYVARYRPRNYGLLIIGANFVFGLCGGFITFIMGAMCYVSDATSAVPHTRHSAYSISEAAVFGAQIIGPVSTGFWAAAYGYGLPLLACVGLLVANIAYVVCLPESLPRDAASRKGEMKVDFLQSFRNMWYLFAYKCHEGRSPIPFVTSAFLVYFAGHMGFIYVRIIYFKHSYGFDAAQIGAYGSMDGLVVTLSMLFAPTVFDWVAGGPVKLVTAMQIGYAVRCLYFVLFGLAQTPWQVYVLLPLLLLTGPIAPYTRTILSNSVGVEEQAKIFSAFSAVEVLGSLVAPLFSSLFGAFLRLSVGWAIFEVFALLSLVALCILVYMNGSPDITQNLPLEGLAGLVASRSKSRLGSNSSDHYHHHERAISSISAYSGYSHGPSPFAKLDAGDDDDDSTIYSGQDSMRASLLERSETASPYS